MAAEVHFKVCLSRHYYHLSHHYFKVYPIILPVSLCCLLSVIHSQELICCHALLSDLINGSCINTWGSEIATALHVSSNILPVIGVVQSQEVLVPCNVPVVREQDIFILVYSTMAMSLVQ